MSERISVQLIGEDGNIFNLVGKAAKALRENGQRQESDELKSKLFSCGSYEEALTLISKYVDIE